MAEQRKKILVSLVRPDGYRDQLVLLKNYTNVKGLKILVSLVRPDSHRDQLVRKRYKDSLSV